MSQISSRKFAVALLLLGLAVGGVVGAVLAASLTPTSNAQSTQAIELRVAMRKLWEDHITWTRLVIVSFVAGASDLTPTLNRLLQNQADIGNAIKPFYGDAAGNQLTALLKGHIMGAADVLTQAKAGNQTELQNAMTRWYANADQIATFLSTANPKNWQLDAIKAMMKNHLDLTLKEAVAQLKGDYANSVAAYDEVHQQIMDMADMLSAGIVNQFPGQFSP